MKRLYSLLTLFLIAPSVAHGAEIETPEADFSVFTSSEFEPVRRLGAIVIGILLGIAVLLSLIFIIINAIKLQGSGSNPMKQDEAKKGMFYSVIGLAVALGASVIVGIVVFAANTAGLI